MGKKVGQAVKKVANISSQIATGGIIGIGDDGIESGVVTNLAKEGVKNAGGFFSDLSDGSLFEGNLEKEATNKRLEDAAQAEEDAIQDELTEDEQIRQQGSRTAQSSRRGGRRRRRRQIVDLGSDERDFLGL